ncbi:MAG TPA: hypothetical protein PKA27_17200 [Fimbriimonadaceae bacterium]|nr:hypothetical protein [Fimbriimonadaceae bacterium]
MNLNEILNLYGEEDLLKADGFDDAVIGIDPNTMRLIYSRDKMVEILSKEMDEDEAIEYLEFNTYCAYVGEKTPIYAYV